MKLKNKIFSITVLSLFLLGTIGMTMDVMAIEPEDAQQNQYENRYQGSIAGNQTHQFQFAHKFQFQIRTNATMNLTMDCDTELVGERNFSLELNTQENLQLEIRVNASNNDIGLLNGSQIQARNQNHYRYQEQFMVNISLNNTSPMNATLCVDTENENSTWAYYDEETGEFVTVESKYQNGILSVETNHFSTWTVLSIDDEINSDSDGDDGSLKIAGYSLFVVFFGLGIVALIYKNRK